MNITKSIQIFSTFAFFFSLSAAGAQYSDPEILFSTPLLDLNDFQIVDYNNDGHLDVVANTSSLFGKNNHLIEGSGTGLELVYSQNVGAISGVMNFYDFDNDGDSDLIQDRKVFENSDNNFILRVELSSINYREVTFYDMDGDGLVDIVPGIRFFSSVATYPYYKNLGNFNFEQVGSDTYLSNPTTILISDLDKDGNNEIINVDVNLVQVFTLLDDNTVENFDYNFYFESDNVLLGDIDGDGCEELINYDETSIKIFFYKNGTFQPYTFNSEPFIKEILLYDYDKDGVNNLIINNNSFLFLEFDGQNLNVDKILNGPESPWEYGKSKIIELDEKSVLLRDKFDAIYQFDLENENLTDGTSITDQFSEYFSPFTHIQENKNIGYPIVKDSILQSFKLTPISHNKIYTTTALKKKVKSMILVELEDNTPVYIISYVDDNGVYIVDAEDPKNEEINIPKFILSSPPIFYVNKVKNGLSVIAKDEMGVHSIEFDIDYQVSFLTELDNFSRNLIEVDLNHDGMKDILRVTNFTLMYSQKTANGYGQFTFLHDNQDLITPTYPIILDYNMDEEIEIIVAGNSKIKVISIDSDFNTEEKIKDVDGAFVLNFTGFLNDNTISLYKTNGHISIFSDLKKYIETDEVDINLITDPHYICASYFHDIDQDDDLDVILRNSTLLAVALNGNVLQLPEKTNVAEIYPNPTNGLIYFKSDSKPKILAIYDMNGNIMPSNDNLIGQPNGVYIVKALVNDKIEKFRIVKVQY